ncbi:MAG: hypothetical protein LBE62_00640 [Azonexus sp.]|jgi:hypothetical protein|nr:hypothetical protein [Azonexus sp.]
MAIQSVNASSNPFVTSSTAAQTQQARQAEASRPVQQAQPPAQQMGAQPQQRVEAAQEAAKPVTNAQGQRTGALINVTA